MNRSTPRVSIGLAVYNGEKYLARTINSFLAQTFRDFELIISDNASTDQTEEISQEYVKKDARVKYSRNDTNIGLAGNFNRTVELATAEYFKWAAADDLVEPEYLERCVEMLDANHDVLVAHTKVRIVDANGDFLTDHDDLLDFRSILPEERFRQYLFRNTSMWNAIFGVFRLAEFRETPLLGGYPSADQVLLGELVLRGQVWQVPKRLFIRRRHSQQSWQANPTNKALAILFDPSNASKFVLPKRLKLFFRYWEAVTRVPLRWSTRAKCFAYTLKWGAKHVLWRPISIKWKQMRHGRDSNTA